MDKHFQEELSLSKSQSAWVQFAHYLGYFLMSMPAGWLASKLGYKGGIIAGLLIVAVGGFWFHSRHPHQCAGACRAACRPPRRLSASWRASASSPPASRFWRPSPIPTPPCWATSATPPRASTWRNPATASAGSSAPSSAACFSIPRTPLGRSTGSQTLYIPYVGIAIVVMVLAVIFFFANVPDIKTEDDYHLDDAAPGASHSIWSAPALRDGGGRAVFLRGRAGRHFQFLHQLHDLRSARHSRVAGTRP